MENEEAAAVGKPCVPLEEVEALLKDGVFVLEEPSPRGKCSKTWLVWRKVRYGADPKKNTNIIKCISCNRIQAYNYKTGTTTLNKHPCVVRAVGAGPQGAVAALEKPLGPLIDPSPGLKRRILRASSLYCAKDFAAFSSVEGEGFISLGQNLIDIGVSYGRVDVKQLLPSRVAIGNHLEELAGEAKLKFTPMLQASAAQNSLAATTDMWTQENKKAHFLTVICHMEAEGKLSRRTAFTVPFEEDSATGENIWAEILTQFALLGVSEEEVRSITFVSDRGSNIIAALRDVKRLNCTAHIINSLLKTALCLKKYELQILNEETQKIVDSVKQVFHNLNGIRPTNVKEFPVKKTVRAGVTPPSHAPMLAAFVGREKEISKLLDERSEAFLLTDLDMGDVKALLKLLQALDKPLTRHAGCDLAGSVWLEIQKVIDPEPTDSLMVAELKEHWRLQFMPLEYAHVHHHSKALVTHVRNSSLRADVRTCLRPDMEVRWNSTLTMFQSILDNYDKAS
ncbi:Transposable element Hobo transposase [Frankliniella fusca]|uniref:Transposable element Hobo transposase n=1 Tax=Frankliniella fusca TaxID=407009 RepID=A0AAE1H838_9NEOP|nr:Transposable element Hobo transposase [Frankliniella fusca]